ncbi:hypothetical protein P3L10_017696 [Capsicum annuum]
MMVAWNVRGFNQQLEQKELKLFIQRNKVSFISISEHRVRADKTKAIMNKVMLGWAWITNDAATIRGKI